MKRPGAKNSKREFEAFVVKTTAPLFRTGLLMTDDVGEAEDLLQETYLKVALQWKRIRDMEYPAAYARRILTNLAIDGALARSRRDNELEGPQLNPEIPDVSTVRVITGLDDEAQFRWALAALTPRQRAVLVLRYWDDLSEQDVATVLDCPIGTVKSSAARGVADLRRLLGRGALERQPQSPLEIREENVNVEPPAGK
jgi:RNA polymerase sigma-70 factor (sigma-E family)